MAETNQDLFEYAKDLAKAEKELGIEKYVTIQIGFYSKNSQFNILYKYDLPRKIWLRRKWVVNWRTAKLQCRYPKESVIQCMTYYDKKSGLSIGIGSDLSKLISAKAQVTKMQRVINKYIKENSNNLFFNEEDDELLNKAREKLDRKIKNVQEAERRLKEIVIKHQENS